MTAIIGASWKQRAIALLHGNQCATGALVVAILGRKVNPPCFAVASVQGGYPRILKNGNVKLLFKATLNAPWKFVEEPVEQFRDRFRHLADALDISDQERIAMFEELKKFIVHDERVVSNIK